MNSLLLIGFSVLCAPGEVQLSDGTVYAGVVDLPSLRLFVPDVKRHVRVAPGEVLLLRSWIEKEDLVQAYSFVEESSRTKTLLPERYPVRQYRTEIYLRSGTRLSGHLRAASFWVEGEEEDTTLILRHTHKGKPGQSLEDLVYVRELRFNSTEDLPDAATLLTLRGSIPGAGRVFFHRAGAPNAVSFRIGADGRFAASGLLPGGYLVLVWAPGMIVCGQLGKPLVGQRRQALVKAVEGSREFFEEKKVLALGVRPGEPASADAPGTAEVWALVGLRRLGKTSAGESVFVRYELWSLAEPKGRIEKRIYLFRRAFPAGTARRWPRVLAAAELGNVTVTSRRKTLRLPEKVTTAFVAGAPAAGPAEGSARRGSR